MRSVLITDSAHPLLMEGLNGAGYECDYQPEISLENVKRILSDYVGIIINSKIKMDREMIDAGSNLRFIARLGSGLDVIDLDYAAEKGINCINSPEGNCDAVAEHAIGMLLCLRHNILKAHREIAQLNWNRESNRGLELGEITIGILGYGFTGRAFAKKLEGFGCKILVYDKYKKNFGTEKVNEVELIRIFSEADVLSVHLPLTDETIFMINQHFLELFRNEIFLLNTSRGNIVFTEDVIKCLKSGKIKGLAMDVFENENPEKWDETIKAQMLWLSAQPNVVLTPHIAGWTVESKRKIAETLVDKINGLI